MTKGKLGNPIIAAMASDPKMRKDAKDVVVNVSNKAGSFLKTAALVGGIAIGVVFLKKQANAAKKRKLLKEAANDPDITVAMQIWEEIPDRFKPHGSLFNPINLLENMWDEVQVWDTSNDDRMLEYASQIKKLATVERVFQDMYQANMYDILPQTMKPENYQQFLIRARRDKTPFQNTDSSLIGKVVVPKKTTTVYRKVFYPKADFANTLKYSPYNVDTKTTVGIANGNLFHWNGNDYIESVVTGKNRYAFYILKSDAKTMAPSEFVKVQNQYHAIKSIILYKDEAPVKV